MKIEVVFGEPAVIHDNGIIEFCESEEQAREVCHVMVGIMRLLRGVKAPEGVRQVSAGAIGRQGGIEKKKVLISIDKDVEIIKGLA